MKYRNIPSMLHNFGHSFVSLMNYTDGEYILDILPIVAERVEGKQISINFDTGKITPAGVYPDNLKKSIGYWRDWLPKHMKNHKVEPDCVSHIELTYRLTELSADITVRAKDNKGKAYEVKVSKGG